MTLKTIEWKDNSVIMIDQTKLPNILEYVTYTDFNQVADAIRGEAVLDAYHILNLTNKKAAVVINKTIESAVANALESGGGFDVDNMLIKTIYVDEGPPMKRFRPRAMGRAARIRKRTCHVTVIVSENED